MWIAEDSDDAVTSNFAEIPLQIHCRLDIGGRRVVAARAGGENGIQDAVLELQNEQANAIA
jgi:hypothetical protein